MLSKMIELIDCNLNEKRDGEIIFNFILKSLN